MREINNLVEWWQSNNISLNFNKTKVLIVAFWKGKPRGHEPVFIGGMAEESAMTLAARLTSLNIICSAKEHGDSKGTSP